MAAGTRPRNSASPGSTPAPAKFDTPAQVTALEQIIGTKPAGILVAALQPDLLTASINKAVRAGIPVVTVDTDAPASLRATYLGTNNYQAGLIMGQQIVKVLKGKGKVGLASVPGQFNLDERIRGIKDVFKQNPGVQLLTVVDDKNDEGATATAVAALIQSHPDINLVACMNAVGAGVAAALRQTSNVGKIHAVLFDKNAPILAAVKDGTADSTLVQRTYMMAYLGVKLLYAAKHPSPYLANWQKHGIVILPNGVDTGVMPVSRSLAGAFA